MFDKVAMNTVFIKISVLNTVFYSFYFQRLHSNFITQCRQHFHVFTSEECPKLIFSVLKIIHIYNKSYFSYSSVIVVILKYRFLTIHTLLN